MIQIDWNWIWYHIKVGAGYVTRLPKIIWHGGRDAYYWVTDLLHIWDLSGTDISQDASKMWGDLTVFVSKAVQFLRMVINAIRDVISEIMQGFRGLGGRR